MIGDGFDEVMIAARRGDEWAWTVLYHDVSPALLGWLSSQRAPHPEDLVSETFLQVVRDLGQFAGDESSFRSWVFTIARHRAIDRRRHEARRPAVPTDTDRLEGAVEPDEDTALAAVDAVTTDELLGILDELTDAEREVLTLRYVAGLSQRECASTLDKTLNNVKQLQKRGLRSLRTVITQVEYPVPGISTLSGTWTQTDAGPTSRRHRQSRRS